MVMSWTWLYLSSSGSDWNLRARNRRSFKPRGSRDVGSGGDMREDRLDEAAHLDHGLAVLVVRFRVDLRMPGDFPAGLRVIVHAPEVVAVRHRRERAVERQDLQAVSRQIELANDLRPQQRHHIGADRVLEAGEDLFRHCRAAEHVAPLDDEHLAARPRQIRSIDQPVVAAADHDHVVVGHKIRRAKTPGGVRIEARPCASTDVVGASVSESSKPGGSCLFGLRAWARPTDVRASGLAIRAAEWAGVHRSCRYSMPKAASESEQGFKLFRVDAGSGGAVSEPRNRTMQVDR